MDRADHSHGQVAGSIPAARLGLANERAPRNQRPYSMTWHTSACSGVRSRSKLRHSPTPGFLGERLESLHWLSCDLCDQVEVFVDMENGELGQFRCGRDQQVGD